MSDMETVEPGQRIVWTLKKYGATCGLSEAHRVLGNGRTFCMEEIPPVSRLVATEILVVEDCHRCAVLHENAADFTGAMRSLIDDARRAVA